MLNRILGNNKTAEANNGQTQGTPPGTLAADTKNSGASADASRDALSKMSKTGSPVAEMSMATVPKFAAVRTLEEIDSILNLDEATKSNAKTLLTKLGFPSSSEDPNDFIRANISPEGKLIVNLSGQRANAKLFKKGFWYSCHSWFSSWFSGLRKNYGTRYLSKASGINLYDPNNAQAELKPPINIVTKHLASGRYSAAVTYDLKSDRFKEPEAIVIYDRMKMMLEDMKNSIPKELPDEIKAQVDAELKSFANGDLDHYLISNLVLLNPSIKDQFMGPSSLKRREELLMGFAETNSLDTTTIFPHEVFDGSAVSKTRSGHVYEKMPGLTTIEYVNNEPKEKTVTATVIRSHKNAKRPISEALTKLFALHAMHDLVSDSSQMSPQLMMQLNDIQSKNKKTIEEFNQRVCGVEPKATEKDPKEEKNKN